MISLSVSHHNALFFISVSSLSNESKPSHSFFSIILLVVLLNKNTEHNDHVNNQVVFNKKTLLFVFQKGSRHNCGICRRRQLPISIQDELERPRVRSTQTQAWAQEEKCKYSIDKMNTDI